MNERKLVLAVDCDDVLVPMAHTIIEHYNDTYGANVGLEHFYSSATLDTWGTDEDQIAIDRVGHYLRNNKYEFVNPFPEAVTAIEALAKHRKHRLNLVTGRSDFMEVVTRTMVDTHFKGCFENIVHTNMHESTDNIGRYRSKGEVCRDLGAHVLIDDHIAHCDDVIKTGTENAIIFGDYPWNRCDILPKGMSRCIDWTTTIEEIDRIARRPFSRAS